MHRIHDTRHPLRRGPLCCALWLAFAMSAAAQSPSAPESLPPATETASEGPADVDPDAIAAALAAQPDADAGSSDDSVAAGQPNDALPAAAESDMDTSEMPADSLQTLLQAEQTLVQQADDSAPEDAAGAFGGLRANGNLETRFGFQRAYAGSIYPREGSTESLLPASYKNNLVLRVQSPGRFGLLFDAEYEHRPQSDTHASRINQAFVSIELSDSVKLRIGKQRVLWGRGFSYIPTDFINPPLDPSGLDLSKIGVESVSVDYIDERFAVSALVRSENDRDPDTLGLKFATSAISGVDLDLMYFHAPSIGNAYGGSFAIDAAQVMSEHLAGVVFYGGAAEHRRSRYPDPLRIFADFAGNRQPFEALLPSAIGRSGRYRSYLLGASYEASSRASMYAEYYRIGDAYRQRDYQDILDGLGSDDPLRRNLASAWFPSLSFGRSQREYVSLSGGLSSVTEGLSRFTDNLSAEMSALIGIEDGSTLFNTTLTSGYFDRAKITWRNLIPSGRRDTEFGSAPFRWYTEISINFIF